MKQHITIEQLNELSEKGREQLLKSIKAELGSVRIYYNDIVEKYYEYAIGDDDDDKIVYFPSGKKIKAYPLLSIGQMIEFLFDNDFGPDITSNDNAFYWIVEPDKKLDCWKKQEYSNTELCDALWEAVKDILEK